MAPCDPLGAGSGPAGHLGGGAARNAVGRTGRQI